MFKLLVQSIFLLLLLGSQRSSAIPAANSVKTLPEELDELGIKNGIGDKGSRQHLDCQAESGFIQEQIPLMTKTLADGKLVALKQNDLSAADETILVLGKAGAGKTSLIQFLTENPKLQSKKVRWKTSEYIIEDGEKIGTSETESFTLYPELVSYNATINFCDSPGFHDSRSSVHEIVSMDVMRSVTSKFKNVKILLIEEYGSLQYSKSKVNFMDTLRDLSDFLVDIDRYKDHIVLIASKLPFRFRMPDEGDDGSAPELITEEMHIERIMDYLNHTEISIVRKLNQKIGKSERDFYQKVIKLLQSLQTRDKNGKAARISVFRRPHKSGSLMSMPLLNQNKESLTKTIINLNAVQVQKNDFHFTLSNGAKVHLKCLLKLTIDNFIHEINELFLKLNEFWFKKFRTTQVFIKC
ncbi:uncharacterized protein LOC111055836 [Nilaparvata lugens]|uniref:uncharacterized protein LOC111055836 n=1 Tax=Nilaparvata lugens TaxID=108931 RepID=UPI00193D1162|nr:uncharacterized protein LOC111055836 [Nilaparvata lugens]